MGTGHVPGRLEAYSVSGGPPATAGLPTLIFLPCRPYHRLLLPLALTAIGSCQYHLLLWPGSLIEDLRKSPARLCFRAAGFLRLAFCLKLPIRDCLSETAPR